VAHALDAAPQASAGMSLEAEHMGVNDIVTRLRQWAIATDAVPASDLMDEAASEIERLRAIMASQTDSPQAVERTPEPPSTPGEGTRQVACTLTDAEREAIQWAVATLDAEAALGDGEFEARQAATLRGLLERTRNGSPDGCETGK
jgi:hypothetical protein